MNETLEAIVLEPRAPADAAVIWMHGLGADGNDFVPIVPELNLPVGMKVRFIFPHAPHRPITINGGYVMRGWYDIYDLTSNRREDDAGIRASGAQIEQLIATQIAQGIPAQRIVLAGFSQGCAMALHVALRYAQRLAGVIALSGYVPLLESLRDEASTANRDVPILMAHGDRDTIVPLRLAERSRAALTEIGYRPQWHVYGMEHTLCSEEILEIGAFVRGVLL